MDVEVKVMELRTDVHIGCAPLKVMELRTDVHIGCVPLSLLLFVVFPYY